MHGAKNIVQYLPNSTFAKEKITRLESKIQPESEAKTIFVLAGVEGVFKHIEVFTRKLKAHAFGVQYSYKNPENSIRKMAETILEVCTITNIFFNFLFIAEYRTKSL